jgi:hypothetical protein
MLSKENTLTLHRTTLGINIFSPSQVLGSGKPFFLSLVI